MASSTGQSIPATTFTQFPNLPKELRLLIWEFTFPTERNIQVLPVRKPAGVWIYWLEGTHWTIDGTPLPALLTCYESRSLAKQTYKPLFETLSHPPPGKKSCEDETLEEESSDEESPEIKKVKFSGLHNIRINLNHDTIVLGPGELKHLQYYLDFAKIKHLALNACELHFGVHPALSGRLRRVPHWTRADDRIGYADLWPNLKSLNFVVGTSTLYPMHTQPQFLPDFRFTEVDSNFEDLADWLGQKVPNDYWEKGERVFKTLTNTCSIAARLRESYRKYSWVLQERKQWEGLEVRVSMAVFRERETPKGGEREWAVRFVRMTREKDRIPKGLSRDWYENNLVNGPYLWPVFMRIGDKNCEMLSRYDGIEELFRE